ncbi:MAG TPA: undecaprenyl-diphosphate phosphatase [Solirubrobacteraceae bacterium]
MRVSVRPAAYRARVTRPRRTQPTSSNLSLGQAVALGLVHGPSELLPISSSAHTVLLAWLAGWDYDQLDPQARKSFEVALHAGALAALTISSRREVSQMLRGLTFRRVAVLAQASAPAALVGYFCEQPIERRLSAPLPISIALLVSSGAMAGADMCGPTHRAARSAGAVDGLLLGVAQAAALIPGVSRAGVTLTVARARGFSRGEAERLSWEAGLPVILGASALRAKRVLDGRTQIDVRGQLVPAATAAFLSTGLSCRLLRPGKARPLAPFALYRLGLGLLVLFTIRARKASGR